VYTHAVAHQKASFLAGERRAMVRSPHCLLLGESPSDRWSASRENCDLGASSLVRLGGGGGQING
jgi:hypothetical protein